jgi:ABC-type dipeptide/oligopeptide/nickel transport system permease component
MSSCYEKYFGSNDISSAKAELMFDIKNHVLYGTELSELINDLEKHDLLETKPFLKETQDKWTVQYARSLATGFALGYFSRDYLYYCAEVAEFLYQKKKRTKLLKIFGIAVVIVVGLIVAFCKS